jgi:glucose/mannose transport system substrate-binding protein
MKRLIIIAAVVLAGIIIIFAWNPFSKPPTTNTLEIFSWWTAGGEAEGLQALYHLYNRENPKVEIINATITGGAGYNARAVLETRMQGGNPPDSFQIHAGPGLIETWIKPGLLEPVTFIYEENGWRGAFPEAVLEMISYKDQIYAVPVNIHRANLIWYNLDIFARLNLEPPVEIEDFFQIAEVLAENGVTPLSLGDKNIWPAQHLLESVIISTLGPVKYRGLWNGTTRWDSPEMESALSTFLMMLEYTNTDHAALTWDEAVSYMVDGKSAMTCIGDFAEGYLKAKGLRPETDFGWFAFPGTDSVFAMISDTFVLPRGSRNRSNAVQWLTLLASDAGQNAFNPKKGSIPARITDDLSGYDEYLSSAYSAFTSGEIVGSFTHGAAATQEWQDDLTSLTHNLLLHRDIGITLKSFQDTALKYLNGN